MSEALREVGRRTRVHKPNLTDEDKQQALQYLESLVSPYVGLHYNEQLALISFIITTRKGSFARSLILSHLNDGRKLKAANEITKPQWYTIRGKKKKALMELRKWQRALFLTPAIVGGNHGT